ncbi:copper transporter [Crassaminicella profunda]|uniref:copper transporter n=1 Tax=Crassaminicella profunda TaxID=1286698 RepID=UPI001CA6E503|nr:copper transporter [Crassaminicella profunda]QZY56818.1 copper transporter [Crassaminicella profunda]
MVINLKYYVITIVAIFLAIGIGIFIGIMLDGQDLIVDQQKEIVAQLESKFDEFKIKQDSLQEKIDVLNLEKDKNERFLNKIYPELVKDKLKDLNVMVLETSEHYDYSGVNDAFKKAGVSNVTNMIIKEGNKEGIIEIAQEFGIAGDSVDLEEQIIKKFCDVLVSGEDKAFIEKLKEKKIIDYADDFIVPADYIVIAGGSIDKDQNIFNKFDQPIINYSKSKNIPIMAVEKIEVAYSNIGEYKKLRISTVDNVDTIIGKISMLMVVSGQEGHFGEKETADNLVPEGFITVD